MSIDDVGTMLLVVLVNLATFLLIMVLNRRWGVVRCSWLGDQIFLEIKSFLGSCGNCCNLCWGTLRTTNSHLDVSSPSSLTRDPALPVADYSRQRHSFWGWWHLAWRISMLSTECVAWYWKLKLIPRNIVLPLINSSKHPFSMTRKPHGIARNLFVK